VSEGGFKSGFEEVRMRIAVYGIGGVGGYFGAHLAQAGEEVVFIARGAHLAAIREHGLHVETDQGELFVWPAQATDDPGEVGEVDVVLVAVKAWQVTQVAQAMGPMMGPATFVVPLQNGVEAPAQLASVLGAERVVAGLCGTFSHIARPGHIRSIGDMHFVKFAELDNRPSERTARLQAAFARAGVIVDVPADIQAALWEKFLFVAPLGGLAAVTRAPAGVLRELPQTRQLLDQGMREILAVACARQIALTDGVVEKTMGLIDRLAPGSTPSLQRDIVDGKPSELEAWNGAVVRLGREVGVATPLHAFIYHSLLPLELRARGQLQFPT
jgi:2-dehydropantoate 2-reductase